MEISGVSSDAGISNAVGGNVLGKDDFLNLLITQLSHQDPLNPMDSAEFTAQLATFTSLEELNNINTTLGDVLAFQQSTHNSSMVNMIGKTVDVRGNSTHLQEGRAEMNYELSENASTVSITITDEGGKLMRTVDAGSQEAGSNSFTWDGKDDQGEDMPDGSYTFEIKAQNIQGEQVEALTNASGTVTSVEFKDYITYLVLDGGRKIYLSDILSIQ